MAMKLILTQDVENLGSVSDIVTVKGGYARNFLIPKGLAVVATAKNQKALAQLKANLEKKRAAELAAAKDLAAKIEKVSVTVAKQVGDEEKIFGSVTTAELEDLLAQEGIKVDRRNIKLTEDIKKIGVYTAEVKLHPEVTAKFKIWVVAQ